MKFRTKYSAIALLLYISFSGSDVFSAGICSSLVPLMELIESSPDRESLLGLVSKEKIQGQLLRIQRSYSEGTAEHAFAVKALRTLDQRLRKPQTTRTGAVFTPVNEDELRELGVSNPMVFGEAWRDPSGLVWGDLVDKNEKLASPIRNRREAETFCKSIGAELPIGWTPESGLSDSDFGRLTKYLGDGESYHPQILPSLFTRIVTYVEGEPYQTEDFRRREIYFWARATELVYGGNTGYFYSLDGDRASAQARTRCVVWSKPAT